MGDQPHYLGIDLGTTNSVIAWGSPRSRLHDFFEPHVLEVEQLGFQGKTFRGRRLPSAVFFKEGEAPIVGEFALKDAYSTLPHLVVRSVKSRMGSGQEVSVGSHKYTPAYISSLILRKLRAATRSKFGAELEDVVITVPASFSPDMRQDTLDAARQAGFKIEGSDGAPRNMLLDEPRAALYFLIHQQKRGQISTSLVDFTSPKNILIFDLGGGTLDVSLCTVQSNYESLDLDVRDPFLARYSRIGGDNFDELIAKFFERRFEAKFKFSVDAVPEDYIRQAIRSKLLLEAEAKKCELNDLTKEAIDQGESWDKLRQRVTVPFELPNLYDNKALMDRLTWDQLQEVTAPLMGRELTLSALTSLNISARIRQTTSSTPF